MKIHGIYITLVALLIVTVFACNKQQLPEKDNTISEPLMEINYDSLWAEIDSLDQKKLYKSAQIKTLALSNLAKSNHNNDHWIKSIIYQNKYAYHLSEDELESAIAGMENAIINSSGNEQAILYSLTAELYKAYFKRYGSKIRNRTELSTPIDSNITTWTLEQLLERSSTYYLASLESNTTREANVADFNVLLTEYNTSELRPTLYDVLAHRAIDYFNENLWSVYQFSSEQSLQDVNLLLPTEEFTELEIQPTDQSQTRMLAIKVMQDLIRFHLNDESPDALVHADLQRLQFVKNNLQSERKDELYFDALKDLESKYVDHKSSAEVSYHIALWYQRHSSKFNSGLTNAKWDLKTALDICDRVIQSFPKSYGGIQAYNLRQQLLYGSLGIATEQVWIPGEHHLLHVKYQNVDSAFIKVLPVPANYVFDRSNQNDERWNYLSEINPVQEHTIALQGTEDLRSHSTEFGLSPLSKGTYVVAISSSSSFEKGSFMQLAIMTVSQIAFWQELQPNSTLTDKKYLENYGSDHHSRFVVVDRKTGAPIKGAMVELYTYIYQQEIRKQQLQYLSRGTTDEFGIVEDLNTKGTSRLIPKITYGDDVLFLPNNYNAQVKTPQRKSKEKIFLFTDRAIYRPGQLVHFKGYFIEFDQNKMPIIKTDESVTVNLINANGKTVDTLHLTTNAFGTFSGVMKAPETGLTGSMSIRCRNLGQTRFRVEEYKRPQFEVNVDIPVESAAFGDTVLVPGAAMMYSGIPVSNAALTYTISRRVSFPYFRGNSYRSIRYYPSSLVVIKSGEGTTNANGEYEISFPLDEPVDMPTAYYPTYSYTVEVTVTDQAGETQSSQRTLSFNKPGFTFNLNLNESIELDEANSIITQLETLNGSPVSGELTVTGSILNSPQTYQRNRLWNTPGFTNIDSATYAQHFPHYAQPVMEQPENWDVLHTYHKLNLRLEGSDTIDLSNIIETVGVYKITFLVVSDAGDSVSIDRYVNCNHSDKSQFAVKGSVHSIFNATTFEPGESMVQSFHSDIPVHLRYRVARENKLDATWNPFDSIRSFESQITESDRGGFTAQYIYVYEGRIHSKNNQIKVPWSNKKLKIDFLSFRDKTEPGAEEEWRMQISGSGKDPIVAEMLSTMYDASLDDLVPHKWNMNLFPTKRPQLTMRQTCFGLASVDHIQFRTNRDYAQQNARIYPKFDWFGFPGFYNRMRLRGASYKDGAAPMEMLENTAVDGSVQADNIENSTANEGDLRQTNVEGDPPATSIDQTENKEFSPHIRTNLNETVFFFPDIITDNKGNITLKFKMNEALTRWKFMSLFHTSDLQFGLAEKEVVTQKELMVMPHVPRFLRQKDTVTLSTRVYNNSDRDIEGNVKLLLFDALSSEALNEFIVDSKIEHVLDIGKDSTKIFRWEVIIPDDFLSPIRYQFIATGDAVGDAEQGELPVVTDRVFVTESMVIFSPAESKKTFNISALKKSRSGSFIPERLTLEYTSNPAWYAVQALPYLQEKTNASVTCQLNRFYANALGGHIVNQFPQIREVFEDEANKPTGLLNRNQDLKTANLEDTPWLRDAESEEERINTIIKLLDTKQLSEQSAKTMSALINAQMSNGGFSWFPGGRDNWYITQHLVEGLGRLSKIGVVNPYTQTELDKLLKSAISYIDLRLVSEYQKLLERVRRGETSLDKNHMSNHIAHYLYTRSYFPDYKNEQSDWTTAFNYYTNQSSEFWPEQGLFAQVMIGTALHRSGGHSETVRTIKQSLEERAIYEEDRGRFWKSGGGWYWHNALLERHAAIIEFFVELEAEQSYVDELRQFLLMHKQTNHWSTSKSTSSAVYALLLQGGNWLEGEPVSVAFGNTEVAFENSVAGSLYSKESWTGDTIVTFDPEVTVANTNDHASWGGVYLQYFEDMDDVQSDAGDQLQVTKELYAVTMADNKRKLTLIAPESVLSVGDEIVVRVVIRSDRDLEFVHLKDMRASGLEPMNVLSRYKYQDGLGYYESTRDLATDFFMDRMRRGTYVFEYPLRVSHSGSFSNGIATLQCLYAPEYGAHSASQRLVVE